MAFFPFQGITTDNITRTIHSHPSKCSPKERNNFQMKIICFYGPWNHQIIRVKPRLSQIRGVFNSHIGLQNQTQNVVCSPFNRRFYRGWLVLTDNPPGVSSGESHLENLIINDRHLHVQHESTSSSRRTRPWRHYEFRKWSPLGQNRCAGYRRGPQH